MKDGKHEGKRANKMISHSSVFRFPFSVRGSAATPSSVLIAVTGMSPAILTETAWALAHERPRRLPARVIAFATTRSREQIRKELLESGVWENLRRSLKAGPDELIFGDAAEHIRVFARRGRELDDLRTPEDNAAAADCILEHLRAFTENPDLQVVASIAGGRKTMGALLYAAMTLIGRESDRITHVLVDEAFEKRQPRFYFPANAREARGIHLADVPFVPLRNKFTELGRMPGSFEALIRQCARELRETGMARIRLDDGSRSVEVDGRRVSLGRRAYVALKILIRLNQSGKVPAGIGLEESELRAMIQDTDLNPEWAANAVLEDLRRELHELRRAFDAAGIAWQPGRRRDALRLPPFVLTEDGKRKTEK